jgi:hypothetical protein
MPRTKKVTEEVLSDKPVVKKTSKRVAAKKEEVTSNKYECKYCLHLIDKDMSICPNCRRNNKVNYNFIMYFVIAFVLLFTILFYHFVDKYVFNKQSYEEYTASCVFVSYEDLVRVPKINLDKNVQVVGKVISVDGASDGLFNNMTITVDMNLFDDGAKNIVTVNFVDKNFEKGFINGDVVKIYGIYETINGNVPYIDAKYIDFNN